MIPETQRVRSYGQLIELLRRDQVTHQLDPNEQVITIPTRRDHDEGVALLRWQDRDGVLQVIHTLPVTVPAERVAAMESAVTRLNHALALPGFGLNHQTGTLYFRVTLPVAAAGVSPQDLQSVFRAAVRTAFDMLPALRRVAEEGADPTMIVEDARIDLTISTGQPQ